MDEAAHSAWAVGVLRAFERFRILCAVHDGPWGDVAINADVVGLMEIENNGEVAANNLAAVLNAVMGANTYTSVGLPIGGTGDDAIRQALIYKPAKLSLVGSAVSETNPIHSRPPLAQTFAAANGEKFSVVVNHFKSKGSCPATGEDVDQGDGQGCWNVLRTEQSQALRNFIDTIKADSGDSDVLIIGDLNAYGMESPVTYLDSHG
jgi:predicted extracellular nuclease